MTDSRPYVGRFAPTPSGPLHFGSLVAAVGSWLDARVQAGQWHLRIDDLDGPRVVPGSIDSILKTLERFGLEWDGDVLYQSVRFQAYMEAVNALVKMQRTFPCACTRKQLAGHEIYPGTCKMAPNVDPRSLRFSVETGTVSWIDGGLGAMAMDLTTEVGDFVLRNAHGIYSYHLANVIDDMHLGITHVVRGADLAPFTAAHLHLQATLGGDVVRYHHLPLVLDERGRKLSKQTHAPSVDDQPTSETLQAVFAHLGMPQVELAPVSMMLVEAQRHWRHRGAH
ncbi:MAG: tRNA glutamyl-Q(34) synthetase GluQRS [Crocinitomicaceae bacterium]|nr:tRNA glutamyl-Q(34) synthetase GluQRS [Crocinitomicaceae bacterium]